MAARSFPSSLARKAEVRDATRSPSIRTRAFMISSAMPSQRYCWSFPGLRSENGRTAIATVVESPADGDDAITGVDHDEELEVVVVRTKRRTNYEEKLKKKTVTSASTESGYDAMERRAEEKG